MIYTRADIITKKYNNTSIEILPQRGAIITSMSINGVELLYQGMLDETLRDTTKSIRCGIPFMFPQAGVLTPDEKLQLGYNMPQHGIARNNERRFYDETDSSISFIFTDTDQQGDDKIPYKFEVIATYTLSDEGVGLSYHIKNNSAKDFKISPGIHPYFAVPLGEKDDIIFDKNHAQQIKDERSIWQNDGTTFLEPDNQSFDFEIPATGKMQLNYDANTKNLWIWSLPGKDFVCIEPVSGNPGNIARNPISIKPYGEYTIDYGIHMRY